MPITHAYRSLPNHADATQSVLHQQLNEKHNMHSMMVGNEESVARVQTY